jgi:uncharacterized protein YjiS (DUF1127 family)
MSGTTHGTTWLHRTSVSTRHVSSLAWKYWDAFQVRGERQKLRTALFDLSDRELMDIGIARDEIDYIASQRSIDPRYDKGQPDPLCITINDSHHDGVPSAQLIGF